MVRVVGVRFKMAGKVYYFDPGDLQITATNKVIVETVRGVEYGEVVVGPKDVDDDQVVQPLKKVIRIGTERDLQTAADNKRKEKEAFGAALKKIEAHTLDMNLVDVEYTFDGSKIIFYFTSEGRVDFRDLVRDLAGVFRTRIEMRQIGVRDEAKLLGGIGPCGRVLCCTSFLGDFAPVSIRMAKDQNLSLNPSKISGLCGRLMCCLRYEQDTYEAAKKDPTLAPGYVPPPAELEEPVLAELEDDRPAPAIGVRNRTESGFSARIAQAAAVIERPEPRKDRPAGGGKGSQQGQPKGQRPQGGDRPDRSERSERPGGGSKGQQPSQPRGQQQGQPKGQRPQGGERPERQAGTRPERQPQQGGQGRGQKPQGGERQGQRPPQEQRTPRPERQGGERRERPQQEPTGQAAQQQGGQPGGEPPRSSTSGASRRRRRRRGPRPEGGGPSNPNPNPNA